MTHTKVKVRADFRDIIAIEQDELINIYHPQLIKVHMDFYWPETYYCQESSLKDEMQIRQGTMISNSNDQ